MDCSLACCNASIYKSREWSTWTRKVYNSIAVNCNGMILLLLGQIGKKIVQRPFVGEGKRREEIRSEGKGCVF